MLPLVHSLFEAIDKVTWVKVHQGLVGSADQVMKNANMRDELAMKYEIIGYEMEAVGVMETTSRLTIRGISDYAYGNKNDDWHSHASLSAAVCSKEVLKINSVSLGGLRLRYYWY